MRLVLSGTNTRILSKAIKSFARISPELFLEAEKDRVTLRGVNQSRSAYAIMVFRSQFFLLLEVDSTSTNEYENKCKVLMKSCLNIFKNMQTVEECTIRLDSTALRLIIKFNCRPSTVKTHSLSILENEYLRLGELSKASNCIIASHKVFSQILQNFPSIDEEITYDVKKDNNKITVSNYLEGAHIDVRYMRSRVSFNSSIFDCYQITNDTTITFCQRELRAILQFANALNLDVTMKFTNAGRPFVVVIDSSQSFCVNLVMSTLAPDAVNNCTSKSIHEKSKQSKIKNPKASRKRPHQNTLMQRKEPSINEKTIMQRKEPSINENIPNNNITNITQIIPEIIHLNSDDDDVFDSPSIFNFTENNKDSSNIFSSNKNASNMTQTINVQKKHQNYAKLTENESQATTSKSDKTQDTNIRPTLVSLVPLHSEDIEITFCDESGTTDINNCEDSIPASPENLEKSRNLKRIFNRCFQPTLDPRPGPSQILAENSDSE